MKILNNFYKKTFNNYIFDMYDLDELDAADSVGYSNDNEIEFSLAGFSKEQVKLTQQSGYIKVEATNGKRVSKLSAYIGTSFEIADATMINGLLTVKLKSKHKSDTVQYDIN